MKLLLPLFILCFSLSAETPWKLHIIDGDGSGADGVRLADINGDSHLDAVTGWEESGVTKIYLNPGPAGVKKTWKKCVIGKTKSVEDAFFCDLNGDGEPEVVTCTEGKDRAVYIHWNPGKKFLLDPAKWQQTLIPASKGKNMWMYAQVLNVDEKNGIDLIAGGKGQKSHLGWFQIPADSRDVKSYTYHKISDAGWIMSLETVDMNNDGRKDLLISDRKGPNASIRWLENPGANDELYKPWKSHVIFKFPGNSKRQYLFLTTTDLNKDGINEIIFPSKKGIHILHLDKDQEKWLEIFIPTSQVNCGGPKAVAVADIDFDSKPEIILTTESAKGKNGIVYFKPEGDPLSEKWQWKPLSGTEKGIKYDRIELLDLDHDGDLDLMTCEENEGSKSQGLGVIWYENPAK